jgi:preprotein translocase subunit Sec61beta
MAQDNRIHMPAGFGGLMRYDEEHETKFRLKPIHVIAFVILIIAFRVALALFLK